ncbi:MAG: hypothetical protein KY395_02215, partial [Actinobacteria bacterium]|nr:hypothetical protein [Actinomycetota bacterium]
SEGKIFMSTVFSLFVLVHCLQLVRSAAGFADAQSAAKRPEDMTPREAFWLDPGALLKRDHKDSEPRAKLGG